MSNNSKHLLEFDKFRIDLGKKVLWHQGAPVQLPAKAVEVLCELVGRRGEVVTKDELLDQVWPDAFVEESVISQNIHHLRKTFRDLHSTDDPIQTIPRRGYRFAGEVRDPERDGVVFEHEILERDYLAEVSEDSLRELDVLPAPSTVSRRMNARLLVSTAAVILIAVLSAIAVWRLSDQRVGQPARNIRSIAVLPLSSLTRSEESKTLSLGLTDSLITRLGRLNKFAVRPFTAVEKFGESGKDALDFGRQLKADAVLEGNVQQVSGRLRVSVRLIDARDGAFIWSDSFDETDTDILKLQDTISTRVARVLLAKLDPVEEAQLAMSPTANPEAYRLYLAGRERWLQRNGRVESIAFYQKAIELDPNFALPYLGIADEYAFTYETSIAESALARAVELDPKLAEAHATRGFLQMFHHWDWQGAEVSFRRAIELAPNSSKAHHWYGVYLSIRGRLDEAQKELETALELDPTASIISTDLAELHYFKRDYERSEAELLKVIESDPTFLTARQHLAKVRYKKGGSYYLEEASFNIFLQKWRKEGALAEEFDVTQLERAVAVGDEAVLRGNSERSSLATAKSRPAEYLGLSRLYAISGEKHRSIEALEKAVEAKVFVLPFIAVDPLFDPVRDDPRFGRILMRMNLTS